MIEPEPGVMQQELDFASLYPITIRAFNILSDDDDQERSDAESDPDMPELERPDEHPSVLCEQDVFFTGEDAHLPGPRFPSTGLDPDTGMYGMYCSLPIRSAASVEEGTVTFV